MEEKSNENKSGMTDILRRITDAEAEAKRIIDAANEKAASISNAVAADCDGRMKANAVEFQAEYKRILDDAQRKGEAQAAKILRAADEEIAASTAAAAKNVSAAAEQIVKLFLETE